jgi:hypothetical protein
VAAQDQHNEKVIQGIHAGEIQAITEAGKSENKIFVPYLAEELKHRKRIPPTDAKLIETLRVALAKLGDTQQLQEFWCNSLTDDPSTGLHPALIFGQIGGWFSIQALQIFLTPQGEAHWKEAYGKWAGKNGNDAIQMPPSFDALDTLPKVVPNPPAKPLTESQLKYGDLIKMWQDWIATHKDELSKLQPTGGGVDFSPNACKNGKPRKKH